jgi:hypothetical protein
MIDEFAKERVWEHSDAKSVDEHDSAFWEARRAQIEQAARAADVG